jgi:hypothetical protein
MTKTNKVFKLRDDGNMLTPEFRVSFPKVFTADENGKFGLAMIFDADTDFSILNAAVAAEVKETWPKGAPKGALMPLLDGRDSDREEYKGKMYINGKCGKYKPGIVDQNKTEIIDESEFYPGCYARAVISLYNWKYLGKCGISVSVRNLQKLRDGEPLISRLSASDDFDAVTTADTEDL